ncbi:hypothetical protein AB3Z07_12185 [Metabacillus halosaccharovorans]|uniref:hypothetical protein n=1 Tax=Metabacillus halosaccharovorans TaxID=930124 RepID=UPI00203CE3BE|nr:hypothetical protein [Metabacillus halosaccharovorans]MCM3439511.1 hypothetical protein [Metabacillus halosaccharovorans]
MMKYVVDFMLAIILTAISYDLGSLLISDGIAFWQAILIGFSVVSLGAITEAVGAPIWLIVLVPFPIGMILLFFFLGDSVGQWFLTYLTTLAIYTVIHMVMSYFFYFHSLIPAWKLSKK